MVVRGVEPIDKYGLEVAIKITSHTLSHILLNEVYENKVTKKPIFLYRQMKNRMILFCFWASDKTPDISQSK